MEREAVDFLKEQVKETQGSLGVNRAQKMLQEKFGNDAQIKFDRKTAREYLQIARKEYDAVHNLGSIESVNASSNQGVEKNKVSKKNSQQQKALVGNSAEAPNGKFPLPPFPLDESEYELNLKPKVPGPDFIMFMRIRGLMYEAWQEKNKKRAHASIRRRGGGMPNADPSKVQRLLSDAWYGNGKEFAKLWRMTENETRIRCLHFACPTVPLSRTDAHTPGGNMQSEFLILAPDFNIEDLARVGKNANDERLLEFFNLYAKNSVATLNSWAQAQVYVEKHMESLTTPMGKAKEHGGGIEGRIKYQVTRRTVHIMFALLFILDEFLSTFHGEKDLIIRNCSCHGPCRCRGQAGGEDSGSCAVM